MSCTLFILLCIFQVDDTPNKNKMLLFVLYSEWGNFSRYNMTYIVLSEVNIDPGLEYIKK